MLHELCHAALIAGDYVKTSKPSFAEIADNYSTSWTEQRRMIKIRYKNPDPLTLDLFRVYRLAVPARIVIERHSKNNKLREKNEKTNDYWEFFNFSRKKMQIIHKIKIFQRFYFSFGQNPRNIFMFFFHQKIIISFKKSIFSQWKRRKIRKIMSPRQKDWSLKNKKSPNPSMRKMTTSI